MLGLCKRKLEDHIEHKIDRISCPLIDFWVALALSNACQNLLHIFLALLGNEIAGGCESFSRVNPFSNASLAFHKCKSRNTLTDKDS